MPILSLPPTWSITYGINSLLPWPKAYQVEEGEEGGTYDMIYVYARTNPYDPTRQEIMRAWVYFNLDGFPTGFTPLSALLKLAFYVWGVGGSGGPMNIQLWKTNTPGEPPLEIAPQYFNYMKFEEPGSEIVPVIENGITSIPLANQMLGQIAAWCSSPPPRPLLVIGIRAEDDRDTEDPPNPGRAVVFYGWQYQTPPQLEVAYSQGPIIRKPNKLAFLDTMDLE